MMALVHDERVLRNRLGVDLVRVEQVDELRLCRGSLLGRDKANVVCRRPGGDLESEGAISVTQYFPG